jgi:hypothetical protein
LAALACNRKSEGGDEFRNCSAILEKKMAEEVTVSEEKKIHEVSVLAQICLTVDHGNATPERGFSINGYVVDKERTNLEKETILAIRMVYDLKS